MTIDRRALADFLRRSRDRIRPQDAGLPEGPRRRTPGLRREEVAQLAGMSADYYIRLEQARGPQPSPQMLAALARALRLTGDERDHLHVLAGHRPPAGRAAGDHVAPGLLHLLDQLTGTPAQVLNDLGDVLAQNALSRTLLGGVCTVSEHGRNVVWRWFADPANRAAYPVEEHAHHSRVHTADLRAAVARRGADPAAVRLVERLRAASEEFAELWERHEVAVRRRSRMRVLHPVIGAVDLDCQVLLAPEGDHRLVLFTPPPGTDTADRLALLRVVGNGQFTPA
ncbi:XRE family transcriptional regulator [Streptomyces eurocidicus]|uniref:Transcriptional regulator with XRE-family HTH domain n=2 Tax=Streptomyces eurocidicus TaxID=66423 RepID=A0A2N8NXK6_STREU|nr:transcriptional regulator with XRE-family HTH domain [Streptomyces eurocidicus]MBF6053773.1 helix-turn-helix domain-containing protein [Streptomyces eurocidicus]PNE33504.1 XRE family transcriptional regulator [Streptomyces eurocidicus]